MHRWCPFSDKDDKDQVIAYFSKSLSRLEPNYCVTRRELLAVVESVKHFHNYLYGRYFTIRADHGALNVKWLAGWKFSQYMPLLFYIVQENPIAMGYVDGLPQRPCDERQYCKRKEDRKVDSAQRML